jgi:hypothetical protein
MASERGARRSACGGWGGGDDVGVEAGQQAGRGAHPLNSPSAGGGSMASGRGATSEGNWGGGDGVGVEAGRRDLRAIAVTCATPAIGRPSPSLALGGYGDGGFIRVCPHQAHSPYNPTGQHTALLRLCSLALTPRFDCLSLEVSIRKG